MDNLRTILAVIDPGEGAELVLEKAVRLARHFGSRLELFRCDSEHAFELDRAYDDSGVERARALCIEEGRHYLERLLEQQRITNLAVNVDAACESPLYESIVRKAEECGADLVIKSPVGEHPMRRFSFGPNDWQLARACPASLMLVRGRKWGLSPKFAAAVEVSEGNETLARRIVNTAEYLALGCGADLEIVHSRDDALPDAQNTRPIHLLEQLACEHHVDFAKLHVLEGKPEVTLPAFAAARSYDVLVLGALTHRVGLSAMVGTLTSFLIDTLDCDFVLVKRAPWHAASSIPVTATISSR